MTGAVAIDLDSALGDTRPLWNDWLASASELFGVDASALPVDRGEAAVELDERGGGNWRVLLERFAEDRAAVYVRRDAQTGAALRSLAAAGRQVGVFTDAPEPLARVALAQLGVARRLVALESGSGALERLLGRLGSETVVVSSRAELLEQAAA